MASIAKRPDGRWRARYRDGAGKEHTKHFRRKVDGQAWLDSVTTAVATGTYVAPRAGNLTVDEWADKWLAGQAHLKPTTLERYTGIVGTHIKPRWQNVKLSDVAHADVQAWVSDLAAQRSPATVRKTHRVLSLMLGLAVRDSRLGRNPADGVNLPRVVAGKHRYLTHAQVGQLALESGRPRTTNRIAAAERDAAKSYELVVLMLAYCGLRWGELAALKTSSVDLMRRRIDIAESVVEVKGVLTWGTPKGHERRSVPVPKFLAARLAEHLAGKAADSLVFVGVRGGGVLRNRVFRAAGFDAAAAALGLRGLHPHELRHTAASLAISAGANVKAVQRMLGHASAAMTLDTYADLFPDDLDQVADALDSARTAADFLRTDGKLITMPSSPEQAAGQ